MKRAFTLIEMLIVVVVLVTLMSIVFKLSSIGGDEEARITTITRLQRLENCLSGYNAAFGSYPPVKLHASRDIYLEVDSFGRQSPSGNSEAKLEWSSVRAACRAQPLGMSYPLPDNSRSITARIEHIAERASEIAKSRNYDNAEKYDIKPMNKSWFSSYVDDVEWNDVQLFRFGVMSFLLPRYLVMMDGNEEFFEYAQWTENNALPCNPWTGERFARWSELRTNSTSNAKIQAQVKNIPSQAATARWLPNLQGICSCGIARVLFGVNLSESYEDCYGGMLSVETWNRSSSDTIGEEIHCVGGYNSTSTSYVLDGITVYDGWGAEFYYYSLPPYQSYTLWSSGANQKTFPPWMDLGMLESETDRTTAATWLADDIVQMSN